VVLLRGTTTETQEVLATLAVSPLIFEFGELLPKSIYYLAPYARLRTEIRWFRFFYLAFLPLTSPLVGLTRLVERLSGQTNQRTEIVLGRSRLVQLLQHGRREGVLSEIQSRLANGLLQLAPQAVMSSMIPNSRVLGVSDASTRTEMLDYARRFGLSAVAVHRARQEHSWYGYAFVAELLASPGVRPVIHRMPTLSNQTSKLEALHRLQLADASYGVVVRQTEVMGVVARNGLIEQMYRPEVGPASRMPA
jgi:CBS domain containing-hemolysin-like protein